MDYIIYVNSPCCIEVDRDYKDLWFIKSHFIIFDTWYKLLNCEKVNVICNGDEYSDF